MGKTLIFVGSSRKGTTYNFAKAYADCLRGGFDLVRHEDAMKPCKGCRKCAHYGGALPKCVIVDPLARLFGGWDYLKVVICSPVYCFHLSAQAKIFIDRFVVNPIGGIKLGLVLAGGDSFKNNRAGNIISTMKTFCGYFEPKLEWCGHVYKRTYDLVCKPDGDDAAALRALAARMGEEFV